MFIVLPHNFQHLFGIHHIVIKPNDFRNCTYMVYLFSLNGIEKLKMEGVSDL